MKNCLFSEIAPRSISTLLVAGLLLTTVAQATEMSIGEAVYFDTSAPLSQTSGGQAVALDNATATTGDREIPLRERQDYGRFPDLAEPDGAHQGPSTAVPDSVSAAQQLAPTPAPEVSEPGLSEQDNRDVVGFSVVPPDINGDIGLDGGGNRVYVQYINSVWGVFDELGNRVHGPFAGNSFWAGFGGFCQSNNDGDPVVLYDDQAGRWFFSQFSIDQGIQCVAVSTTSDPLGPYHRYAFVVTPGGANDYPKLGVWDDGTTGSTGQSAYTFTLRDFGGAGGSFSVSAGVMERDAMLVGAPAKFVKFINPCSGANCMEGQLPAHLAGPSPPAGTCPSFWAAVDAAFDYSPFADDGYRNHSLCVDWSNPGNSTYVEGPLVVAGSNFDRFLGNGFSDCVGPVKGGDVLDCLTVFTMYRAQYRWFGSYGSVVLNTTVDASGDRAGIRWAEVRSANGSSGWLLQQDGTYAPADGLERWMGSIAQDKDGNIALGYSVAGSNLFPSVRYTSRMAGDTAGAMSGGEVSCHEGTGAQTASNNRWGDYSSMSVDPTDDCTFWYTQEYYEVTGSFDFNTRICSFKLPSCGGTIEIDDEPPSVPGVVQIGEVTTSTINISWSASTDNVAVTGYEIFRDGGLFTAVAGTSFADTGLPPSTTHGYQVRARDAAGNRSELTSPEVSATTDAIPPDVITLIEATFKADRDEFKVRATSSEQPDVSLEVVGFGTMTFKKGKYEYRLRPVGNVTIPPTVDIVSSHGALLTVTVVGAPLPPPPPSPPGQATNPVPADGAGNVDVNANLGWTAGSQALTHTVYFGTSATPPEVSTDQSETVYEPGELGELTTYYWQINETNAQGTTPGEIWSFTTGAAAPADTVVISKAEWRASKEELKVEVTSTGAPAAELTVEGFGQMTYNAGKNIYSFILKPVNSNPGTVTVTSSLGGSATKDVRLR